jgi:hypothetical protein
VYLGVSAANHGALAQAEIVLWVPANSEGLFFIILNLQSGLLSSV